MKINILSAVRITVVGAIAGVLAQSALANTVFTNGLHNAGGGNNPFSYDNVFVAQDFQLSSATNLDSVTFNAYTTANTVPITSIQVKIYGNNSGSVGSELFSGVFSQDSAVFTESAFGYDLYDFTALLPNWNLGAGSYWLGLQVNPSQWDMHWSITNSSPSLYGSYYGNNAGDASAYTGYGFEHVFRLTGSDATGNVPDSTSSSVLLVVSLFGLALARRRAA